MCKNIAAKAKFQPPISIYDISASRAQDVHKSTDSTRIASSIPDAVEDADIIFYSVPDDNVVLKVLDEILATTDITGKTLVDCSTIHPDTTTKEQHLIESAGADFVACPVFGAAAMADSGQLICNLAGKPAAVAKVKPFCDGVMSSQTIDLTGTEPANATLMKIIGNSFVLNMVTALSEGHVLAEKSGLGTENLHKFIALMFPGPYTKYSERMLSGDYYTRQTPLFSVDLARKDARHAQSLAKAAGMEMKNVALADAFLEVVQREKGAVGELAAIYGAKRMEAGLRFENK